MDFQAYHAFLKLGSLPFPLTLFKKIKSLEPGSYLKFSDNTCSKKIL